VWNPSELMQADRRGNRLAEVTLMPERLLPVRPSCGPGTRPAPRTLPAAAARAGVPIEDAPTPRCAMAGQRERNMKHPSNRELFAYWNERRGTRPAPERADIEPSAIRRVLGDTFVLAADRFAGYPFRLAGTRLCALFGRELKGESFVQLWQRAGQTAMRELIAVVIEEKTGVVASVTGAAANDPLLPIQLELTLLPLAYESRADARVLGAMAPMTVPYWLGAKSVGPLALGMFRHIGAAVDAMPVPRLTPANGRLRRGLTVYEGGRRD